MVCFFEWIDVREDKPPVEQNVLLAVVGQYGQYTTEGCLRKDGKWVQYRWDAILREGAVIAWCYMPEVPTFEEDE